MWTGLKILGVCIATWLMLDTASWLVFERMVGHPFDLEAIATARAERRAEIESRLGADRIEKARFVVHPYLGYAGRPGADSGSPDTPFFNAWGVPAPAGQAYPSHRGEDRLVIAVLGGSFAEMFATGAADQLRTRLAELDPDLAGLRVELVNLSNGGYKQPQQLNHLAYALLSGFQFDAIVNIDGFNELAMSNSNRARGFNLVYPSAIHYGFVQKAVQEQFSPGNVRILAETYATLEREQRLLEWMDRALLRLSPFANLVAERTSARSRRDVEKLRHELVSVAVGDVPPELRGPDLPDDGSWTFIARVWVDASRMIGALSEEYQIPYAHFLQPNQYIDDSKVLTDAELAHAWDPEHEWSVSAREGYPYLIEAGAALRAEGIDYHDLTEIYRDVDEDVYVDSCCHVGPRGNEFVARAVAEALAPRLAHRSRSASDEDSGADEPST